MLFSLEALQAKQGDCLILHYGSSEKPRFILIDGGPGGVYKASLRPRLDSLKQACSPDAPLPLQLLMVSHIDDDHIHGILDLTAGLADRREEGRPLPYNVLALWHNSFDDILGNRNDELFSHLAAAVQPVAKGAALPAGLALSRPGALVVASVGQGRDLRDRATRLGLEVNHPFGRLVVAPPAGPRTLRWGDELGLTVLGPSQARIEELHADWEREVQRRGWASDAEGAALAAAYTDKSVYNLSSIVVLAELQGRRMLLTGDARGDDILAGLRAAGLLPGGRLHVDLLKVPHHGSDRNVDTDFFRQVTADRYVISGNGQHGNPEVATLKMISEARGKAAFTLYLTNRDGEHDLGKRLRDFFAAEKARGRKPRIVFRKDTAWSVTADLLDPVDY
jgi:hypothetical protein